MGGYITTKITVCAQRVSPDVVRFSWGVLYSFGLQIYEILAFGAYSSVAYNAKDAN